MRCPPELLLILSLIGPVVFAAAPDKDMVQLSVHVSSQESSNALRTHDNAIQEHQDILGASLNANLQNEWAKLTSLYDVERWRYAEKSLPRYTQIEGRSVLLMGANESPVGISVSHSRHTTLSAPDAINIASNRDERTLLSAQPWLKWRVDGNDNLRLTGIYTEVDFQKNEIKNLKEKGASLSWEHRSSKTDSMGLSIISTHNNYEFTPQYDYKYRAYLANYAVELNHLSYSLSAGENQAQQENQNVTLKSPLYKMELAYKSTANEIGAYAGQTVTNSSNGGGNRDGLVSVAPDSNESAKDLIRMREGEVYWVIKSLCALCNLKLGVAVINKDYNVLPDDDTQNTTAIRFSYQMSRALSFSLAHSRAKHDFATTSLRTDYTELISEVAFDYRLAKSSAVKLYVRKESRDSISVSQTYEERIVGLNLAFEF